MIFSALAAFLSGCAAMEEQNKAVKGLEKEVAGLRVSVAESNARLDELNNKFSILHEKVQGQKSASSAEGQAFSPAPPSGLAVVSLADEEEFLLIDGAEAGRPEGRKSERPKASTPVKTPALQGKKRAAPKRVIPSKSEAVSSAKAPEEMYNLGQDHFIAGRFEEARGVFTELVSVYPKSDLADNALYWTAETYYTDKDYKKAVDGFNSAVERYPSGNKAPDSLLKAGFSYMELADMERARAALDGLVKRYPGTDAAVKAKKTLERFSGEKGEKAPYKEGTK